MSDHEPIDREALLVALHKFAQVVHEVSRNLHEELRKQAGVAHKPMGGIVPIKLPARKTAPTGDGEGT